MSNLPTLLPVAVRQTIFLQTTIHLYSQRQTDGVWNFELIKNLIGFHPEKVKAPST